MSRVSRRDLARKAEEVSRLRQRLAAEPGFVRQSFPAEWSYVIEHYAKTGRVIADVQITPRGGGAGRSVRVTKVLRSEDSMIRNPNPAIGLRADGLTLPSDETVHQSLLVAAGSEGSERMLAAMMHARRSALEARSKALAAAGQAAGALETAVDAALVIEPVNSIITNSDLKRLRARQKQLARAADS